MKAILSVLLLTPFAALNAADKSATPKTAVMPIAGAKPASFADFTDESGRAAADPKTTFQMITDGKRLLLDITLAHPADRRAYGSGNPGNEAVRFNDNETVEVFIAPGGRDETYYHFALEPGGAAYDNMDGMVATDFESGWSHFVEMRDDAWVARLSIPLAGIGRPEGFRPGDRFAMNVCRATGYGQKRRRLSWSPAGGKFNNRDAFAEVVVGSFREAAERELSSVAPPAKSSPEVAAAVGTATAAAAAVSDEASWRRFLDELQKLRRALDEAALAGEGLKLWEVPAWNLPPVDALPAPTEKWVTEINVEAFQNEHVSRAFGIAFPGGRVLDRARIVPGRLNPVSLKSNRGPVLDRVLVHEDSGQTTPLDGCLTCYEAQEIQMTGIVRRDVLQRLRHEDSVAVPRGGNGVLWLHIHTAGLAPGAWTTNLEIRPQANQKAARRIPLRIRVLPAAMPEGPRPYATAWCVEPYRPEPDKPQAKWGLFAGRQPFIYQNDYALRLMREFQITAPLVHHSHLNLPSIKYDENGRAVAGPDLSGLEEWIRDFGTNAVYVFHYPYGYLPRELGSGSNPDPVARANFAYLIHQVRAFFEKRGVGVENFAWYFVDEVRKGKNLDETIAIGRLLQETDPEQRLFVTFYSKAEPGDAEAIAPYVNLWVPKFTNLRPDQEAVFTRELASGQSRFFSYGVHPRVARPYEDIRAMGLEAFNRGYEGVGIFSFGTATADYGTSLWNDDPGVKKYTLFYEGENGPIYSVRLMAWRMGIQDFRLFKWAAGLAAAHAGTPEAVAINTTLKKLSPVRWPRAAENLDAEIAKLRPLILTLHPNQAANAPKAAPKNLVKSKAHGMNRGGTDAATSAKEAK